MNQRHPDQPNWRSTTALVLSCIAVAIAVIAFFSNHGLKIGFVRSKDLISKYEGMKEAEQILEQRQHQWESEIDTLQSDYRRTLSSYNDDYPRLTSEERKKREGLLQAQENNVRSYTNSLVERSKVSEQTITQGVLNQINSAAEKYGRDHGFEIILSTLESGNIIYGTESIDITNDLLSVLNNAYRPGNIKADSGRNE